MDTDFSLPTCSKWALWMDAPFRYGGRHIYAAGTNIFCKAVIGEALVGVTETVYHIAIGLLELVPGVGLLIAIGDKFFNEKKLSVVHIQGKNPYEMGLCQGKMLKKEIQFSVHKVMKIFKFIASSNGHRNLLAEAKKLEKFIPSEYILEMKGIAEGAKISYDEVLMENTLLDKIYGCSLLGICRDPRINITSKEIATNFYPSFGRASPDVDESFKRYDALKPQSSTEIADLKEAMLSVNYWDTIHSIVFDCNKRDMHIATGSGYAANRSYTHLKGEALFGKKLPDFENNVKLARTLDWPLKILSTLFTVFKRDGSESKKATTIVGLPGMIGALSGINEDGTALAISVVPSGGTQNGIPNPLLFRKILEEASTVAKAQQIVKTNKPSSAMNLVVAARDGVSLMEIDSDRKKIGYARLESNVENVEIEVSQNLLLRFFHRAVSIFSF